MEIDNLEGLIKARERQMGSPMLDERESQEPEAKSDSEVLEIMKLLFTYIKQSIGQLHEEITTIKTGQEKILTMLKEEDKE